MLTFKQFIALMEGLNPLQKKAVSSWIPDEEKVHAPEGFASRAAVELSSHIIPEGQHHIIIPAVSGIMGAVHDHLKANGFRIKDYANGLAEKLPTQEQIDKAREFGREAKPQEISIGKALAQTKADDDLITGYESDDRQRAVDFNNNHHILISREANAIAGCSTDKPWKSCGTMGADGSVAGAAAGKLPTEIKHGTLVAYQIPKQFAHLSHDEQIDRAVSRVLLKPFTSEEGHTILRPEDKSYSKWDRQEDLDADIQALREKNVSLISALENFTSKHYPLRDLEYKKHAELYNDDKKSVRINFAIHPFGEHRKQLIKKLKKGEFNVDDVDHAKKNGYYDDGVKDASVSGFFRKLNRGVFDKTQAFYHENESKNETHQPNILDELMGTENNGKLITKVLTKKIDDGDIDRDWYNFFNYKGLINQDTREQLKEKIISETGEGRFKYDFSKMFPYIKELHTHARNSLLNELELGNFDREGVRDAVRYGYFDGDLKQASNKILANKFKDGDFDRFHLMHATQLGYLGDDAKEASREFLIKKLKEVDYGDHYNLNHADYHLQHAVDNGYFNKDVKEASRQSLKNKFRQGFFDEKHLNHATENGYLDREIKEASRQNLIDNLKIGKIVENHLIHAKENGYYDDEVDGEFKQFSKKKLMGRLEKGKFDADKMNNSIENGYFDNEVKEKSRQLLIHNLKKGIADINHMEHASENGYFDKEAREEAIKILIDKLNNGSFLSNHVSHATKNDYFNKDVREASRQLLLRNLNMGVFNPHHIIHASENGYYDDEVRDTVARRNAS